MAQNVLDCQQVPSNVVYDCSNPWPTCKSSKHFDFASLWNYTNLVHQACPTDSRLYRPIQNLLPSVNGLSLTQDACIAATGGGWTNYPRSDVWTRLTTWKFPLVQLALLFPRPPLSGAIEAFVIFHLLGDPIDTIANLLGKLSKCQQWARHWHKARFPGIEEGEKDWRALTLITDAYAEWEQDERVENVLHEALTRFGRRPSLRDSIRRTAQALAADRATKILPTLGAQFIFVIAVVVALWRTADVANSNTSAFNNTIFVNVEAFSIAFSALYFWIIPTISIGSFIGVSQTKAAIPRIVGRFQKDLNNRRRPKKKIHLPNECLTDSERRKFHGGIYQWQPSKFTSQIRSSSLQQDPQSIRNRPNGRNQPTVAQPLLENLRNKNSSAALAAKSNTHHMVLAHLIVIAGAVTAFIISSLVPPGGFNCRHAGDISILVAWIVSAYIDVLLNKMFPLNGKARKLLKWPIQSSTMLFSLTFIKDIVFTAATMIGVILTQVGILNRCECYSNWGRTGTALPQIPDVDTVLRHRINSWYPAITALGLGFQLILVPCYIVQRYGSALRVYIQRDDTKSNTPKWLNKLGSWGRKVMPKGSPKRNSSSKGPAQRPGTPFVERGNSEDNVPLPEPAKAPAQRRASHHASSSRSPLLAVQIPSDGGNSNV